tara:strand:- start:728 stop:1546 length:819 start_codon:yes stop_codon:yes gene_type:complete
MMELIAGRSTKRFTELRSKLEKASPYDLHSSEVNPSPFSRIANLGDPLAEHYMNELGRVAWQADPTMHLDYFRPNPKNFVQCLAYVTSHNSEMLTYLPVYSDFFEYLEKTTHTMEGDGLYEDDCAFFRDNPTIAQKIHAHAVATWPTRNPHSSHVFEGLEGAFHMASVAYDFANEMSLETLSKINLVIDRYTYENYLCAFVDVRQLFAIRKPHHWNTALVNYLEDFLTASVLRQRTLGYCTNTQLDLHGDMIQAALALTQKRYFPFRFQGLI